MEPCSGSNSSSPPLPTLSTTPPTSSIDKSFAWRMLGPEQRRYQLFPKDKPVPSLNIKKSLDPEAAFAVAMGDRNDKGPASSALRLRINQNNPPRRRKISVPELGPMTTVQEIAMDSPTIPGLPPLLHERSSSVPKDARDNRPLPSMRLNEPFPPVGNETAISIDKTLPLPALHTSASESCPGRLTPLVFPVVELPTAFLQPKISSTMFRSDSTPPTASSRNPRLDNSPLGRPRIPPSSSTPDLSNPPKSATSDGSSTVTLPTPVSAPVMDSRRGSPKPWDGFGMFMSRGDQSAPLPVQDGQKKAQIHQHRRGASESSTASMTDRGRSRKRTEIRANNGPLPKPTDSKRAISSERRAFEELPRGWKPSEAAHRLNANDVAALQKQALGQVERFEVLRVEDVETLSKELRHLDDRTDYLRRTYTSLRAGRRNLHSRICQYLRSPRVAKFSHDSMLRQEEALAELDTSIDDWVTKLEQAENRRTRVRQKLLEHVAAAALLPIANLVSGSSESFEQVKSPVGPREPSTPPRSPSKASFSGRLSSASPSPQRVVAQVPSTILEQPVVEDAADNASGISRADSTVTLKRSDVESIRIYAGDDVYALLADVENEFSKMGVGDSPVATPERVTYKEMQRQRSREQLTGRADSPTRAGPAGTTSLMATNTMPAATSTASSSTPSTPSTNVHAATGLAAVVAAIDRGAKNATPSSSPSQIKDAAAKEGEVLLTAAVFKP
ncbi:hypothetical protein ED733_008853 [Metarhizium rileyi]|uniref:Up-regulated during septation protein 1 domain-containing protein n=1 Tax=Metarhizium rileyi (strain RCEF 4871) TaxID=1649241 RepID=A0A5C6GQ51_METRR|nr:hypothetical protein ED733_008853 [Metarhizium rileyi]